MSKKFTVIVLSAGESSRFAPLAENRHKSLTKLLGKELIRHSIESALNSGANKVIIVHGPGQEEKFRDALNGLDNVIFVLQPEPKGMGNALLHAANHIDSNFIVFNADRHDASDYIKHLIEKSEKTGAELALLCSPTKDTYKYGIAEFDPNIQDKIIAIHEKPGVGAPSNQRVVGIYYLPQNFLDYYKRINEHQYAFEDAISLYSKENNSRAAFIDEAPSSTKYAFDLLNKARELTSRIKRKKIAKGVKIAKSAVIEGAVEISEGSRIFENAVIKGPVYIGKNCRIGNNALIRENSIIEDGCIIGMNTEVTRSVILEGTHIHSGFIGDSVIGQNCRLGANFISANRRLDRANIKFIVKGEQVDSGKKSLGCIIGENTKAGVNVATMPGTIIGANCIIGSGTEVKGNVPSGSIVYEKRENINYAK
ncbi:MAG: NTP transferase domain-containing protein [Candidatus Colwellbacteria bacterium]|nr:NTP transferase domain-containing protein [Candidatus Colwellbacteria bacterium]